MTHTSSLTTHGIVQFGSNPKKKLLLIVLLSVLTQSVEMSKYQLANFRGLALGCIKACKQANNYFGSF